MKATSFFMSFKNGPNFSLFYPFSLNARNFCTHKSSIKTNIVTMSKRTGDSTLKILNLATVQFSADIQDFSGFLVSFSTVCQKLWPKIKRSPFISLLCHILMPLPFVVAQPIGSEGFERIYFILFFATFSPF